MWQRLLCAISLATFLGACSGAVHQLPKVDQADLNRAQSEVQTGSGAPARHAVSAEQAMAEYDAALTRIRPAATQLCHEMAVGVCDWRFVMNERDASMNAGAMRNGIIVVNRGIAEYADNNDEIAMVIAHEIGHQAANHVSTSQKNQAVGAAVGNVLIGPLAALVVSAATNSAQSGATIGARLGRLSYSKEQEREADYLAVVILYRSNIDLDKARAFLVKIAQAMGRSETGAFDTHPAGPERLAAWDQAVQEVRASKGALPKKKGS